MSVALFIVAEREVPGLDTFVNGKALGHCDNLDQLAERAGVRPLMEFFSEDPTEAAELAEEAGIDPPPGGFPPKTWFPAADGLTTVRGLLAYLGANPGAIRDAGAIVSDLREFEEVFEGLAAAGVGWHLAVDY